MWGSSLQAVFFDLDGTLLDNDMRRFAPAYLDAFAQRFAPLRPPEATKSALRAAVDAVLGQASSTTTVEERFWREFVTRLGVPADVVQTYFAQFDTQDFATLRGLVGRRPEARRIVRQAYARGWTPVLATNPTFPGTATDQRIAWAGLQPESFAVVTTMQNSYACKPNPTYFRTLLHAVSAQPHEALMVGDDWTLDIAPADAVGMRTYWITAPAEDIAATDTRPTVAGSWDDFVVLWNEMEW